jgi:hypothetical protein
MQDLVVEIQDPVAAIRLPRTYLVQGMRMDMLNVARHPGSAASTGLNPPVLLVHVLLARAACIHACGVKLLYLEWYCIFVN